MIYLALAVVGLILLAGSLDHLRFQEGTHMPVGGEISSPAAGGQPIDPTVEEFVIPWALKGLISLGILVVVINILIAIVKNTSLKQLLARAGILLALIAMGYLLSRLDVSLPVNENSVTLSPVSTDAGAGYEFTALGDPPTGWFQVVKVLLIVTGCLMGAWLIFKSIRVSQPEDALALEVGAALKAIEDGADFRDVILNAYLRMLRIVKEEQGIEREESVTPREFEALLTARGIPQEPILQITRLFEKARYGNKAPEPEDEQAAVRCLTAIRESCLAAHARAT
ncbi:hypothetical protein LARV_03527 [Longilinea arvoryzae]|uniref:Protein-glutamine gamma-glutamyltransferase-like C-terminal domain-containing protein n=1 Tax=Longilinea arvoryzae TaxID=360412 RepID=A0A0S7BD55_9CHLR|nr:DUF4129 domain-containing protein [Longilinea arvoryzae]GAP15735.1 hypothetical protein LARV_03527 [Longilinea arvoryzae]